MPIHHWLQLSLTRGIGPILIGRLVAAAGSAEAACGVPLDVLRSIDGIGRVKADAIHRSLRTAADEARAEFDRAAALGVAVICPDDEAYPVLIRSIPDPPAVLYVMGVLEPRDLNAVALVGSRKCSGYGREQAERFGALLAGAGVTVVSGGARGIDSAAHRGALSQAGGRTVAVLGCGVDVVYPPENAALFREIAGRGAVVSEYALGTPPVAENFPRRNRIVSGLSRGVLVIEADERSGALITARQAGDDHGRPVFALPGRVDNPLSNGPHQLIRDGAVMAASVQDILDHLGPLPQAAVEPAAAARQTNTTAPLFAEPLPPAAPADDAPGLTDRQRAILSALGDGPAGVDAITDAVGLPVQTILQELTFLSLRGRVRRVDGQTFARR